MKDDFDSLIQIWQSQDVESKPDFNALAKQAWLRKARLMITSLIEVALLVGCFYLIWLAISKDRSDVFLYWSVFATICACWLAVPILRSRLVSYQTLGVATLDRLDIEKRLTLEALKRAKMGMVLAALYMVGVVLFFAYELFVEEQPASVLWSRYLISISGLLLFAWLNRRHMAKLKRFLQKIS